MIQILINSIALDPNRWTSEKLAYFRLDELLRHIAAAGFHFVEVWQYHISRAVKNEIMEYRKIANSVGVSFPVVGMYPVLHMTGLKRQTELDNAEQLFNSAKLLGAEIVKAFVGVLGSDRIAVSEYQRSVEFMQNILEMAQSYGLTVTGETHPDTLFDSVESCTRFRRAVGPENLKVCFQAFDFSNTNKAIADYRLLSDDVIHVHYQGRKDGRMALLADSDLDYAKMTTALLERGFSGPICIEFVKSCVVQDTEDFDMEEVLSNAVKDRDFVVKAIENSGTADFVY